MIDGATKEQDDRDGATKERDNAKIFTHTQRDYLNNDRSVNDAYASVLKTRIQHRVVGSIEDIQLFKELNKKQRKRVYESNLQSEREGDTINPSTREGIMNVPTRELFHKEGSIGLTWAFMSFFEFYHRTMRENGYSLEDQRKTIQYSLEKSEQLVQNELKEGRYDVNATLEIDEKDDITRLDTDERLEDAMERFEEDGVHGVTSEELKTLATEGYITLHGNWE